METVKVYELKDGRELRIVLDENAESPREWDNLGNMVCWHRRYSLGDKTNTFPGPESFDEWWEENGKDGIIFPLNLYDHDQVSISTSHSYPYNDHWDAGQVGWIYITADEIRKNWSVKRITKKLRKMAEEILLAEVEQYDQYLRGDVYGFQLVKKIECDECGHVEVGIEDSCWGFYGDDIKKNGILDNLDKEIADQVA